MAKGGGTWDAETIADFRRAFAALRAHPMWCGYQIAAGLIGYKSARGLRWAAGEYHSDGWPGSYRLAAQLREMYDGIFTWIPPRKITLQVCPTCGGDHGMRQIPDCAAEHVATRIVRRASHQSDIRPRLPLDPALRIAKLSALLRQAEAELQEAV
jgi:hypothetical protein